jgi:L-alanine-DL-glutamate epimerase-like enolase superfamily enzyme
VPFIEVLSPALFDSPLRAELTRPEPELEDGMFLLPAAPGLGIELVDEVVEHYRVEA